MITYLELQSHVGATAKFPDDDRTYRIEDVQPCTRPTCPHGADCAGALIVARSGLVIGERHIHPAAGRCPMIVYRLDVFTTGRELVESYPVDAHDKPSAVQVARVFMATLPAFTEGALHLIDAGDDRYVTTIPGGRP